MTRPSRNRHRDDRQADLFADARALYPVQAPKGVVTGSDYRIRLSQAIGEALHECGKSRTLVACEMSAMLGEQVTEHMINAYASPAREGHDISMTRLHALVRVTGQLWLLHTATEGLNVTILAGQDAIHAQRGLLRRQIEELESRDRELAETAPLRPQTVSIARGRK